MRNLDIKARIEARLDGHSTYSVEPLLDWLKRLDGSARDAVIAQSVSWPAQVSGMREQVLLAMSDPRFAKVKDGSSVASYLAKSSVPRLYWPSFARLLDPFAEAQLPRYVEQRAKNEARRVATMTATHRHKASNSRKASQAPSTPASRSRLSA